VCGGRGVRKAGERKEWSLREWGEFESIALIYENTGSNHASSD
jgi:hypothetical protein